MSTAEEIRERIRPEMQAAFGDRARLVQAVPSMLEVLPVGASKVSHSASAGREALAGTRLLVLYTPRRCTCTLRRARRIALASPGFLTPALPARSNNDAQCAGLRRAAAA
eukprot:scaffold911_cov361-Prasinococcus_capsulatus_cf.AAC.5